MKRTEGKPCPSRIWIADERRWIYCEQGDEGHWGTCCGSRSKARYEQLLNEWKERKKR